MAVRLRLKRMGRKRRPFFRVCAMDHRSPRDGRVIEELGYYDPMVKETDARAVLKRERIDYWISTGALPTEKVGVLIKKYGSNGTHLSQQQAAMERLKLSRPTAPPPEPVPVPQPPAPPAAEEASPEEAPSKEPSAEAGDGSPTPEGEGGGQPAAETTEPSGE